MNLERLRIPLQMTVVTLASYLAGRTFTDWTHPSSSVIGALWSLVSGVVALQATIEETHKSAARRLVGTLIGAIVGALYLSFLPFSALGMALCAGFTVFASQWFAVPDNGRLAAITVGIVMLVSIGDPDLSPALNGALRFVESCIGAGIAVATVHLWPGRNKPA
jgi:uncharacterized membrane protein YccC